MDGRNLPSAGYLAAACRATPRTAGRELDHLLPRRLCRPFSSFPRGSLKLIEPLRFMRMIHFLAWQARQRGDNWLLSQSRIWAPKQFWIRELEDLKMQAGVVRDELADA
ncbi:MAG: hypothetical protein U5L98_08330 [Halomonas sp.]|uniref:hypothetical protein n=1 Tax=Halomonas sp. TaxID=1486246 RepID=UPI002ACE0AEB|nr:hypothetical protein [Halomonas sp.]MDZ7852635.1 hypothetical protein [Halomonas sp.]